MFALFLAIRIHSTVCKSDQHFYQTQDNSSANLAGENNKMMH